MGRNAAALWAGRKQIGKLTLIIHNFMDAGALVAERVAACSFMVATDKGFVSMCAHNAARETFIRRPLEMATADGQKMWDPLSGTLLPSIGSRTPAAQPVPVPPAPVPLLPAFVASAAK